jgi:hypothetical protein
LEEEGGPRRIAIFLHRDHHQRSFRQPGENRFKGDVILQHPRVRNHREPLHEFPGKHGANRCLGMLKAPLLQKLHIPLRIGPHREDFITNRSLLTEHRKIPRSESVGDRVHFPGREVESLFQELFFRL